MNKLSLNSLILLSALFPYSPNLLGFSDIEPFCFILCSIFIGLNISRVYFNFFDIPWILAALFSISTSFFYANSLTDIRTLIGGLSFIVFFLYGYNFLCYMSQITFKKIIIIFLRIWLLVSAFQLFGISFEFLSPNRTTMGRGLTSLAAEATFAGLHIIAVITLSILFRRLDHSNRNQLTRYELVISQFPILLHASATALVCYLGGIIGSISFQVFSDRKFLQKILIIFIVITILFLFFIGFENPIDDLSIYLGTSSFRIFKIWESAITGQIMSDASAFDRLTSTFKFLSSPYLFPQVINHEMWINDINSYLASIDALNRVNYSYRNLSGLGQLNVVLGLLYLLPMRGIYLAFLPKQSRHLIISAIIFAYVLSLLFSTTLTNPLFGIVLGLSCKLYSHGTSRIKSIQ